MSKFVHMELNTSDPDAAQKFYKGVFGWKFEKMTMGDGSVYWGLATEQGEGFGGMGQAQPGHPSAWLGYVGVDSIKRTITKVEKRGGKVLMPKMDIPGMGSLAVFTDPQGAMFAIWQEATPTRAAAGAEQAATEQAAPAPSKKASKKKAAKKAPAKKAPAKKAPAKKASKKAPANKASKKAAAKKAPAKKASKAAKKKASKK